MQAAAAQISPDEAAKTSPDEHMHAFLAFVAGLIGDAERYLAGGDVDPLRDGASYRLAGLWLTDTDLVEFLRALVAVVQPRLANPATPARRRWTFATVLLPDTGTSR